MVGLTTKRLGGGVATVAIGLALGAMAAPRPAAACGGTFCDGGPAPMPVEQTGETIVFVLDGSEIEVHIQIQYDPTTEAEQFAWLVPVTALPEFSVGSQQLFGNLLASTVPAYGITNYTEPCDGGEGGGFCDGTGGNADEGGVLFDLGGGPDAGSDPEVVLATTVGAFEVFVLDGGTVDGVMQWLGDNGFQQDPAAAPILGEYLDEGLLFVAFRLATDAEAAEIHPIVLRMPTTEPCVPIRLTRIAAQEDMDIRAFFLADGRVSSANWRHVTLNPLKLDWIGLGINYREVVTLAVDEPGADGHAWVTEYAGDSEIVSPDGISSDAWFAVPFETATPQDAAGLLLAQGFYAVDELGECVPGHPLIAGLVDRWLPTPPATPAGLLCSDPAAFGAAVDPVAWDGPGFAADLDARIIAPGLHASELLLTWPYLTRLYTTISPGEMTEDPTFQLTPEQPEQTTLTQLGRRNSFCDGDTSFSLPDERLVALLDPLAWPDIAPEEMPWAETIQYLPTAGAPVVEVDNRDLIQTLLDAWNTEHGPPQSPAAGACGDTTGGTTDGAEGGLTSGGTVFTSGTAGDTGDSAGAVQGGGCECRAASTGPGLGGPALLLSVALGIGRRRRTSKASHER